MSIRLLHIADVHFGDDNLEEVSKCAAFVAQYASEQRPDCVVISGDLYDHRLILDSPAASAARQHIISLSAVCPVLILRGTELHDFASLDSLIGLPNVAIATQVGQLYFYKGVGFCAQALPAKRPDAVFYCLPSVSKEFRVALGASPDQAAEHVVSLVERVLIGWGEQNDALRSAGIATVLVGHGTINGAVTSTGYTMLGQDLVYSVHSIAAANCDYQAWGHIHKAQKIGPADLPAWYAGSIARLNAGEQEAKGFIDVHITAGAPAQVRFVATPAREIIVIDLGHDPHDWQEVLRAKLSGIKSQQNAQVKVKASVSEAKSNLLSRSAIEELIGGPVIFDKTIVPIQRTRAEGISRLRSIKEKYVRWAEATGQRADETVLARLDMLDRPLDEILADISLLCDEQVEQNAGMPS